ncbi:hypothetical protein BDM02DRAFT_693043 [Thelephora ganbajun]|uniref:Uncharacterized protein n=1 Tax=Thelephora ganbajun TaxID=370292 RepID=A0ACB6Z640_THEGA|nr:hypothetical protein BDM02DRAFT_693043 [Thelephora ganbajun]
MNPSLSLESGLRDYYHRTSTFAILFQTCPGRDRTGRAAIVHRNQPPTPGWYTPFATCMLLSRFVYNATVGFQSIGTFTQTCKLGGLVAQRRNTAPLHIVEAKRSVTFLQTEKKKNDDRNTWISVPMLAGLQVARRDVGFLGISPEWRSIWRANLFYLWYALYGWREVLRSGKKVEVAGHRTNNIDTLVHRQEKADISHVAL